MKFFYQAVFERVIRYDHQPPARAQHLQALFERHAQRLHPPFTSMRNAWKIFREVLGLSLRGVHGRTASTRSAVVARGRRARACSMQLAAFTASPPSPQSRSRRVSLGVRIGVGDVGRRAAAAPVHAHVEGAEPRNEKPRSVQSKWCDDTPRSASTASASVTPRSRSAPRMKRKLLST